MGDINFDTLLEEFSREQERDQAFFEELDGSKASAEVLDYIYRRLYLRRKFLAQFRNIRPRVDSESERQQLLEKISSILAREETLARRLQELRDAFQAQMEILRQRHQALKAYQRLF